MIEPGEPIPVGGHTRVANARGDLVIPEEAVRSRPVVEVTAEDGLVIPIPPPRDGRDGTYIALGRSPGNKEVATAAELENDDVRLRLPGSNTAYSRRHIKMQLGRDGRLVLEKVGRGIAFYYKLTNGSFPGRFELTDSPNFVLFQPGDPKRGMAVEMGDWMVVAHELDEYGRIKSLRVDDISHRDAMVMPIVPGNQGIVGGNGRGEGGGKAGESDDVDGVNKVEMQVDTEEVSVGGEFRLATPGEDDIFARTVIGRNPGLQGTTADEEFRLDKRRVKLVTDDARVPKRAVAIDLGRNGGVRVWNTGVNPVGWARSPKTKIFDIPSGGYQEFPPGTDLRNLCVTLGAGYTFQVAGIGVYIASMRVGI